MNEQGPVEGQPHNEVDVAGAAEIAKDRLGVGENSSAEGNHAFVPRSAEEYVDPSDYFMRDDPMELTKAHAAKAGETTEPPQNAGEKHS